ncbi:MAG: acyl-CoA synthetase [Chloroflexota bacterium]
MRFESRSGLELIDRAKQHWHNTAIIASEGSFTYQQLDEASTQVAATLLDGEADLQEARVAFLTPRGFHYVTIQWGIWRAGGIAVPLCEAHPEPELAYVIDDSDVSIVIAHPEYQDKLQTIAKTKQVRFIVSDDLFRPEVTALPLLSPQRRAMILYTSGTTGKPKGVVSTHANIEAQVTALVTAWEWQETDHILNVLPLHHTHGITNVLTCALWSGATCEILLKFTPEDVWKTLAGGRLTLFMAVPTIYARLIAYWREASPDEQQRLSAGCGQLRLMVSGSAALPVSRLEAWREISGHTLLERYGMTEIGMGLSNALHGERLPGFVGTPLPNVQVRVVDEDDKVVTAGQSGELQVKGPNVFHEYFGRPKATAEAFSNGWFRTGDMVVQKNGAYRILGRNSVDIIKTGGYKVSALEIEEVLRTHPDIQDCAVVGVPDEEWGECVAVALTSTSTSPLSLAELRAWGKERLAPYKVPSQLQILDDLPRNVLGKVTKPAVVKLFES